MCDGRRKNRESDSKEKFYANVSIITRKSFFRYIKGHPRVEYNPSWPPPNSNVYPKANAYYAFTEDTNPFTRLEDACKCLNVNDPHFEPPREAYVIRDPYNEDAAWRKYIGTPPAAFAIFGKPGLNTSKLASMIADSWGCVLISPEVVLKEEIDKNTDKGKYIAETLKCGGCIGPEIVMNLIESRVRMRDVMHRGYIVEGLPIIPNEILDYSSYPEPYAGSQNLDTCPTKVDIHQQGLSGTSLNESSVCQDSGNSLSSECHVPPCSACKLEMNHDLEIPRQIENIFCAWPIKPTVLIYAICPDQDLVKIREQIRLSAHTGQVVDANISHEKNEDKDEFDMQFYREVLNNEIILDEDERRHLLLRISDMRSNVQTQCQIYKNIAMPVIEKWVLTHNPQNVVRVDGRTSVSKMFDIVSVRLRILPIPRLLLPKFMTDRVDFEIQGEGAIVTLEDEYDGMSNQEAFEELTNKGAVSARFPWRLSLWNFFCPVELAMGKTVEGTAVHAVRFMSNLFFLSSREAADLFVENPRPFLLPPNPRPPCRIIVFGPRYSGKSEVSRILAQKFGGHVIDINEAEKCLVEDKINAKVTDAMRRIVHNVIKDLRKSLETERERRQSLKTVEILSWFENVSNLVSELLAVQSEPKNDEQQQRLKSVQQHLRDENLNKLVTDRKLQRKVKKNMQLLYDFMPERLKEEEPPVRELSEHDPEVVSILESHVNHLRYEEVNISPRERVQLIIDKIKMLPEEPIDIGIYRDNGFIIDGMSLDLDTWSIFAESNIVFEDIILLWQDEPFDFLIKKWHRMRKREEPCDEFDHRAIDDVQAEFEGEAIISSEMIELEQYIAELRHFVFEWNSMKETIEAAGKNLIICDLQTVHDVPKYIEINIWSRYKMKASVMTDEEKEKEKIIEDMAAMENGFAKRNVADEGAELDQDDEAIESTDVRRLGDTSIYCPVSLALYKSFSVGKEEFSALYGNKIYMLFNEKMLEQFIEDPRQYAVPFDKPPLLIPQLRLSIVGSTGCGKTTISDKISKEYGLTHIDYGKCLVKFMKIRSLLPLASNHCLVLLGNYLETVDLPEDLSDQKYNIDKATVRTFIQSYVKNGGILPNMLRAECHLDFFKPLYEQYGLIFDGFPSCKEDVHMTLENHTVPEIIFELQCSLETSLERRLPDLMNTWSVVQKKMKRLEETRYREALSNYETNHQHFIKRKMAERRRLRLLDASAEAGQEDDPFKDEKYQHVLTLAQSTDSLFGPQDSEIFDPDPMQAEIDRQELEAMWKSENPEPELFTDWEDPETARERITQEFETKFQRDVEKLISTKEAIANETIPWIEIDAERSQLMILIDILKTLDSYMFRDTSVLERCYRVDLDKAERLLECGYYLLSSFGRWCPIQLYERKNPIPMFFIMEANDEIYPVIHRRYIYFLGGKEACTAFMKNPMKYIEQDSCAPLIPLRISIIGPPKCGKTTLAERFAKTYGMKVITRGRALRHMLANFSWSEIARLTEAHLRSGHAALDESIARCVEMYSIDPRAATQGYILDGFPVNRAEYEELAFLAIQPMVVVDLVANLDFCIDCLSFDDDEKCLKKPGNLTPSFLAHRYDKWHKDHKNFRDWLRKYSDNIVEVDATLSKWYVWTRADELVRSKYTQIFQYFRHADYDTVHKLAHMCISPYEFRLRQSIFESFCPSCLFLEQIMETSEPPLNRDNVVQFREFFYWFCSRHIEDFISNPLNHLPPINTATLPKERPEVLEEIVDPEHSCWARRLKAGGFCVVHYVDNLPNRTMSPGRPNLAVIYLDKVYLFCSAQCRKKFLSRWKKYANTDINYRRTLSPIDIWKLPNLGFLEQTVARLVVRAIKNVGIKRPKIPGLSASATAAIYIGVFLKIYNDSNESKEVKVYERIRLCLDARAYIISMATSGMKIKTRRVPVPDARFDYLCEYFKPASKVPAFLNVVDIAGLVKGAAEGQGLGNAFLSHISACDGIFHLCRAFEDDDVTHIEGDVNPARDLEIISEELRLKDVEFLHVHLEKLEKLVVRGNDKKLKPEYDTLLKVKGVLMEEKKHIRFADWSANDIEVLNKYLFLTSKPVIYLINLSEKDYIRKKNKWLVKIKEWVDKNDPGAVMIPFSGAFENKVLDMDEAERAKYFEEQKVTSALDKIIVQGYKALQLQYFFTAGHDEVKAWTIQKGTKAPQAAGKIHTDFEKGFIMAEVMKFDDFKNEGSEAAVKAAGKYRQQGRNYVVEDGDIIFFKFNAGAGLKDPKKK